MPEEGVTVPRAGAGSVAVIIAKLGPYHAARMVALGALLGPESVLVLEVAQESREYTWERVATSGFRRRTLVTSEYEAVSGHALKKIMYSALEEEQPEAVAINGWGFPEARAALAWCRSRARIAVLMSDSQERDLPAFSSRRLRSARSFGTSTRRWSADHGTSTTSSSWGSIGSAPSRATTSSTTPIFSRVRTGPEQISV